MNQIQVFVSFDVECDAELYERLLAESLTPGSGFTVSGGSESRTTSDGWRDGVRRRMRAVDQVIFICGENTSSSTRMSAELLIAQEEGKPYFLLWGRRETMCTKPVGAKPAEGMYSWTQQILYDQMACTLRNAQTDAAAETLRRAPRKA